MNYNNYSKEKYFYRILLHIILPLLTGFIIYLSARNNTWLNEHLQFIQFHFYSLPQHNWFFNILQFNLPDFCWDYSFSSALFLWKEKTGTKIKYFPSAILFLLIAGEGIQVFFPYSFTFDWLDMVAAFLAFCSSYLLNYKK
jgi:hypothetical protein